MSDIDPRSPTAAKPGSEDKVAMLAARYAAGLELWHKDDNTSHAPTEELSSSDWSDVDDEEVENESAAPPQLRIEEAPCPAKETLSAEATEEHNVQTQKPHSVPDKEAERERDRERRQAKKRKQAEEEARIHRLEQELRAKGVIA